MRFLVLLFLIGCGTEHYVDRSVRPPSTPWRVIGSAEIQVDSAPTFNAVLGSGQATISSTVTQTNGFNVSFTGVGFSLAEEARSLGTLTITGIDFNHLKVCGPSGNSKCTLAKIRLFTTQVPEFPGVAGFVHEDGYGIPVWSGKSAASERVGLSSANAAYVDSYGIPASDNKLTSNDFGGTSYVLEADVVNAGVGGYKMILNVELVVQ